jgi:hypothetical protein
MLRLLLSVIASPYQIRRYEKERPHSIPAASIEMLTIVGVY